MPTLFRTRLSILCSCLTLSFAAGCGGSSPTAPSDPAPSTGAVISGRLTGGQESSGLQKVSGAGSLQATSAFAGFTVRVMGTSLSAIVGATGAFEIPGVPAGNLRLQFTGGAVNATADLADVRDGQYIEIQVVVSGTSASITGEARSRKVSLCHTEGNGSYQLIDVSDAAEAAHREHGDAMVGEAVPGQPGKTFDSTCRPVGPSVEIEKATNGEDADSAPGPEITVGSTVTWTYVVTNTGTVNLTGIVVADDRTVVVICNGQTTLAPGASMTCTGSDVVTAIGPYRNVGTVTAQWTSAAGSGSVTDSDPSNYLGISPIEIEKLTNGEEADTPPGPSILVGSPVTWEYRVTNIGTISLTGISVTDDRGVSVNCNGQTALAAGASMTCIGTGVAVLGQYSNIGTVTANWSAGQSSGTVTASDPSHYLGVTSDEEGPKVSLCHKTGAGFYVLISVSINAEPAHLAHGDGKIGGAVPGLPGKAFGAGCSVQ